MDLFVTAQALETLLLVSYFFIASQGAFYLLAFAKALGKIPFDHFIILRKVVDHHIRRPLKLLYLITLFVFIIWFILRVYLTGIMGNMPIFLGLLFYIADILLIIKISEPLNKIISNNACQDIDSTIQKKWINTICFRGYFSVTGFIIIMIDSIK